MSGKSIDLSRSLRRLALANRVWRCTGTWLKFFKKNWVFSIKRKKRKKNASGECHLENEKDLLPTLKNLEFFEVYLKWKPLGYAVRHGTIYHCDQFGDGSNNSIATQSCHKKWKNSLSLLPDFFRPLMSEETPKWKKNEKSEKNDFAFQRKSFGFLILLKCLNLLTKFRIDSTSLLRVWIFVWCAFFLRPSIEYT